MSIDFQHLLKMTTPHEKTKCVYLSNRNEIFERNKLLKITCKIQVVLLKLLL